MTDRKKDQAGTPAKPLSFLPFDSETEQGDDGVPTNLSFLPFSLEEEEETRPEANPEEVIGHA